MTDDLRTSCTSKIPLTMKIKFMSSKGNSEKRLLDSKSDIIDIKNGIDKD